ncbi:14578_t:CDS:2, partial [Racocetra persica]
EGTCETCCDYSRCLIIQYPVCDSEHTTRTNKICNYKENHERCKDETCRKCCDFYNKIISCRNCYLQDKKCEWSRVIYEEDFNLKKKEIKTLGFYSARFEKGSEFEKLHLQGYIQFNTRVTGKYVKQHFGNNLHIVVPTFNPCRKQNSDRPYKTDAECRHKYFVKRYDKCAVYKHCSCSYIDPEDVCDECLPTKETCMQSRRSLKIKNRNGIIIEKYIFENLNKKIGSRKRVQDRSEEEIADDVSVISNNNDYLDQDMTLRDPGLWKKKPQKNVSKNDNQNESKIANYKMMLDLLGKGKTAYLILKKNPNLFMKASQLKALEPDAQQENLKAKILVTRSKWKPEDFLIPKIVNNWISNNILNKQKRKPGRKCSVLVMKNRKGKWSLVESLVNYGIKIAHFHNIYNFTTTNKMNERVFNGRKYAQLLLGKDRILINQRYFLERSVPIIVLCTENTYPFIYNCNTEDDDFLRRFFENAL